MNQVNIANSNNFLALKPEQEQVYKDFLASNNTKNFILLTQPDTDTFLSEKDKKRSKVAKYAVLIATGAVVLGAVLSSKFLPGSLKNKIKNIVTNGFNKLIDKLDPKAREKGERAIEVVKKGADKLNVLNNFTTLKDVTAKELVYKYIPPLRWLDKKSSGFYRNTAVQMVSKKFDKAFRFFGATDDAITKALGKIDPAKLDDVIQIDGVSKTVREFSDDAAKLLQQRNNSLSSSFGSEAQKKLAGRIDGIFENVAPKYREEFVENVIKGKDRSKFFTFMIRDMHAGEKEKLAQELNRRLSGITSDTSQGLNDQLTKILDAIIDKKTNDREIKPLMKIAAKKLDEAVGVLGNDFFDKIRDIGAGCAPTDILCTLFSLSGLGIYMNQAETKDEKVSVAMTTGIPLGLGMLCSTYAIMKMVSGFNALGIGFAASAISSLIGKNLDKSYKKNHGIDENAKPSIPVLELPIDYKDGKLQSTYNPPAV